MSDCRTTCENLEFEEKPNGVCLRTLCIKQYAVNYDHQPEFQSLAKSFAAEIKDERRLTGLSEHADGHKLLTAAIKGTQYSPPSPPETQSSETMSPIYPDRPIRPLPKRRLKDRLSSDAAETISYPSAPVNANTLFYSSNYEGNSAQSPKTTTNGTTPDIDKVLIDAQAGYPSKDTPYEFHGTDPVSDDEGGRQDPYRSHTARAQSHSVTSAESDHGYDSFENSNNKKKRKIPTSSNSGILQGSLAGISADMANMGISTVTDGTDIDDGGTQQYYGQGYPAVPVPGTGISGAGRGRYGRSGKRDSRSPLSASANASNWQTGRLPAARQGSGKYHGKADFGESGIISQAIAKAANSPMTLDKGQENISLLEQQQRAMKKNTPAAQFTFNMDSEAAKGPAWPGDRMSGSQYPSPPPLPPQHLPLNSKGYSQGTQTSPSMPGPGQGQHGAGPPGGQPPPQPPKPRRPAALRYARAARQRKVDQEYQNYNHPPEPKDIWICEFCEYEAIFGRPPLALIRQYEAKDAKERRRQAEKKRLLEKAKSKGRKARKGTKASKANAAAAAAANSSHPPANGQQYSQQGYVNTGHAPIDHNQPHSDEYYSGDGYDDDGDPPISTPTPTKIPGPVNPHYGASQRPVDRNQAPYPGNAQRVGA